MATSIRLIVRFDSNHGIPVDVTPSTSVEDLKKLIAGQRGLAANDVRVIFCGRELQNHMTIKDYEFDRQSIVHVVRGRSNVRARRDINLGGVTDHLGSITEDQGHSRGPQSPPGADQPKPQFYVYCKDPCKGLKPGKLRVRCADCKQSTLLLDQEPGGWDDVLKPRCIRGRCQHQGCRGIYAEFYFKCAAHPADEKDNAVPLYLVRTNTHHIPCITCDADGLDLAVVFPCAHLHVMCMDCFRTYGITKLNDRQFVETRDAGYTLACPAGCEDSHIKEAHHFRLLGDSEYERFHRFGTEEFVLQAGGVLCPNVGCGMGLLPEGRERRLQCTNCRLVFCRNCKEAYHQGQCQAAAAIPRAVEDASRFAVDPRRAERARWDREAKEVIQRTTKSCPKCEVRVEKNGGCMHMTCSRANCKFEWCWICGIEWNRNCQGSHWFG